MKNKALSLLTALNLILGLLFSAFAFNVYAVEATTEKTDYYDLTQNGKNTYHLDFYGDADLDILKSRSVVSVSFYNCSFENLKKLPANLKLKKMQFNSCTLESLDGIEKYNSLTYLGFIKTDVNDISRLSKMNDLTYLGLSNMEIKDLSVISGMKKLSTLNFRHCNFKDLSVIPNLGTLKQAEFFYCNMESINGIERLSSLQVLYFSTVGIDDISPISSLTNLTDLALEITNVKDLSPIESLVNLKTLDIDECLRIESLDSLKKLDKLKRLWARNCQMALSEDVLQYLNNIGTETTFTQKDLQIKESVIDVFDGLNLENKSDEEKIKVVTQYVVDNIKYDFDVSMDWRQNGNDKQLNEYNNNALKYALLGKGCCRNYTALMNALLTLADVDIYEVRNDEHIWNAVKVNNEFYWIDTIRIDEIDKGNVLESPDYMTQSAKFFELHKATSVPSSYYVQLNEQQEETTEVISQVVVKELDTKPIFLVLVIVLMLLGLFIGRKKEK